MPTEQTTTEFCQDLNSGNWLITLNGVVVGLFGRCDRVRAEKAYARLLASLAAVEA